MNFYTALVSENWGQTFTEYFRFGACSPEEIVSAKLFMNYGAVERLQGGRERHSIFVELNKNIRNFFKDTKVYWILLWYFNYSFLFAIFKTKLLQLWQNQSTDKIFGSKISPSILINRYECYRYFDEIIRQLQNFRNGELCLIFLQINILK